MPLAPLKRMHNRLPVGPGSRGGHWHDPEYRRAYYRAWRAAHPRYVELDRQRRLLSHAMTRCRRVVTGGSYARPQTPVDTSETM